MMDEKYQLWLPFYVNGTLSEADRAEMESYLASNPAARDEIAFFEKVALAGKASKDKVHEEIGMAKALEKNRGYSLRNNAISSSLSIKQHPLFLRFRHWLGTSWVQPAFAVAVVVIGLQTALLVSPSSEPLMRGRAEVSPNTTPLKHSYVRVVFQPSATEGELRILLGASNAHFVSGPDNTGAYTIAASPNEAARVLEALRSARIVTSANPVARLHE